MLNSKSMKTRHHFYLTLFWVWKSRKLIMKNISPPDTKGKMSIFLTADGIKLCLLSPVIKVRFPKHNIEGSYLNIIGRNFLLFSRMETFTGNKISSRFAYPVALIWNQIYQGSNYSETHINHMMYQQRCLSVEAFHENIT